MKLNFLTPLLTFCIGLSAAASTFSPARPPAIPLAVKSPYMSTWQYAGSDGGNGGYLAGQWPQFWAGQITGWAGLVRVDGTTYTWMGAPTVANFTVTQTAFEYTSTQSIFTLNCGTAVQLKVTFLSPLTPDDFERQSLVSNYLNVEVSSLDGNTHSVQLYADISAEWVSGDRTSTAEWDYDTTSDGIAYHQVYKQDQYLFTENSNQAEWGYWYWATKDTSGLTYESGQDAVVRGAFASSGELANSKDTDYRAINDDWPVFGFAVDLGDVGTTGVDTLFTLSLAQEYAIRFTGANGTVSVPSLWRSYFSTDVEALSFFYNDYSNAVTTSNTFDSQVSTDSINAGGQDYLTITSLSVRQAFGATQLTGTESKTYLFLKEISSDGDIQTVDVIFPFHPVLLYTNPTLLKLLLDPLFENQESGDYPNTYSMHDMGAYPNATGYPAGNDEQQPLEECGNMLIMTLAYAQRANDNTYLSEHYDILKQWTGYLVAEALIPADQISTDDFAGSLANQTNLALKGMIGIGAMAEIANRTGNTADAQNYSSIALNYIEQWQTLGIAHDASPPHTTLAYGMNNTHGLLYNLYGDKELSLGLVPQSVYDMQSAFYPTVNLTYGVPLDTRHNYTKADWEMFTAAIASDSTKDMFIGDVANWINVTPTNRPLTDLYSATTGDYPGITFVARPVMGGSFALLALP